MMDSIAFEEWALKSLDKELSPKPWASRKDSLSKRDDDKEPLMGTQAGKAEDQGDDGVVSLCATVCLPVLSQGQKVPMLYPSSIISKSTLESHLEAQLKYRVPHHKQRMWWWLLSSPVTAPFALVSLRRF